MKATKEQQNFLSERNIQVLAPLSESAIKMLVWSLGGIDASALKDMSVYTCVKLSEKVHQCRLYFEKVGHVYKAIKKPLIIKSHE